MAAVRAVRAVAALLSADDLQEPGKLGVMTWVFRRKMRPKGCPENHLRYSGAEPFGTLSLRAVSGEHRFFFPLILAWPLVKLTDTCRLEQAIPHDL